MMLPVSSYEELLARVRSLTSETIQLRHEISTSLQDCPTVGSSVFTNAGHSHNNCSVLVPRTCFCEDMNTMYGSDVGASGGNTDTVELLSEKKGNETDVEFKEVDEKLIPSDVQVENNSFHPNGWPPDTFGLWHSGPSSFNSGTISNNHATLQDLTLSVTSNSPGAHSVSTFSSSKRIYSHQQLDAKVEMVYSLLSMLDADNREDMSKTFLAMSSSAESCQAMRQSGCLPLLVQLIHSYELNKEVRKRAAETLHNIVYAQTDEKRRRKEIRVLKLLEQVREYCDELKNAYSQEITRMQVVSEKHPITAIGTLMKFSFDAEHRQAICILGGLHAITQLLQLDHEAHGSTNEDSDCITLRRYAGMSLTNLTFGDGKNKALLCSFSKFLRALVDQLKSASEDLRQVTASVLRNLSWRADSESKQALRNVGAVTALTVSAMEGKKESTLKSILSALWNLSAHCSLNKIDICSVPGALAFLVKMLRYKSPSSTLSIIENAGGILRNISSHIAVREDYRQILRDNNCFEVLLEQLKSPSLTVVSNACGTLWNLSARCPEDQKRLCEMGATTMLRSLVQSKHKMISMGSSAALKNLLTANPDENLLSHLDSTAKTLGLQNLPTLFVRKKRALEQELNITLAETCDNIDLTGSPILCDPSQAKILPKRSESHDSVQSIHSDSVCMRLNQITLKCEEEALDNENITLHDSLDEKFMPRKVDDQKLMRRYKSSMIPTPTFKKINQDRINEKTKEEAVTLDGVNGIGGDTHSKARRDSKKKDKETTELDLETKSKDIQSNEISDKNVLFRSNNLVVDEKCYETTKSLADREYLESKKSYSLCIAGIKNKECENEMKNERYQENLVNLKEGIPQESPSTASSDENVPSVNSKFCEKINEIRCGIHENTNKKKIIEQSTTEKRSLRNHSLHSLNNFHQIVQPILTDKHPAISGSDEVRKICAEENFSNLRKETAPKKENFTSNDICFSDVKTLIVENRFGDDSLSHVSLTTSLNVSPCCCSIGTSELLDGDYQNQEVVGGVVGFEQPDADKLECTFLSSDAADKDALEISKSIFKPERSKIMLLHGPNEEIDKSSLDIHCKSNNQHHTNADGSEVKTLNGSIFPKFKIGSPITDSNVLQAEAKKICSEINKQQDFDMGCSLTSEVSLVSCSSFLDTGDYSLFDSSADAIDFDESELAFLGKTCLKIKSFPFRKSSVSQTTESLSLPSLGSLKSNQLDTLDLDNSVLSVASITSELAETSLKDFEVFNTFTKPFKKCDAENGFMEEEAIVDVSLITNGDDTLNADSLQNTELFDEDSSLHSQENLPLDQENSQFEKASQSINKRLTPKEKRKTFQDRYRTYTIRNFQDIELSGKNYASDFQGKDSKVPVGDALQKSQMDCSRGGLNGCNFNDEGGAQQEGRKIQVEKFDLPCFTFDRNSKNEKFYFSKSLDKEQCVAPDFLFDSKSLTDLPSIGPAERKELVDNAKLVAFSLKTAIQEGDVVSDSEPEDDYKSLEIDTATYSKNHKECTLGKFRFQELQREEQWEDTVEEDIEKKGARILKPNVKENKKLEDSKGIRGRRKSIYSIPRKNSSEAIKSPSVSPKMACTGKKIVTDAIRSSMLQREDTFTKENISDLKKVDIKNSRTVPMLHKNFDSRDLNFSRPFNKNKSVSPGGHLKRTGENQLSKIKRPLSTSSAVKCDEKRAESSSNQRRPFSSEAGNRIGGNGAATSSKSVSSNSASPKMRNSSSNQNIKVGKSFGSGLVVKSKNLPLQNSKSQSDASLNVVVSKDKDTLETERTPKKVVTSKIASLWKKVEETKQRKQHLNDNRVWICPENVNTQEKVLVIEKEDILDIPTRKIVHSFTCQTLADETPSHFCSRET